jgi:hypothetical protein
LDIEQKLAHRRTSRAAAQKVGAALQEKPGNGYQFCRCARGAIETARGASTIERAKELSNLTIHLLPNILTYAALFFLLNQNSKPPLTTLDNTQKLQPNTYTTSNNHLNLKNYPIQPPIHQISSQNPNPQNFQKLQISLLTHTPTRNFLNKPHNSTSKH